MPSNNCREKLLQLKTIASAHGFRTKLTPLLAQLSYILENIEEEENRYKLAIQTASDQVKELQAGQKELGGLKYRQSPWSNRALAKDALTDIEKNEHQLADLEKSKQAFEFLFIQMVNACEILFERESPQTRYAFLSTCLRLISETTVMQFSNYYSSLVDIHNTLMKLIQTEQSAKHQESPLSASPLIDMELYNQTRPVINEYLILYLNILVEGSPHIVAVNAVLAKIKQDLPGESGALTSVKKEEDMSKKLRELLSIFPQGSVAYETIKTIMLDVGAIDCNTKDSVTISPTPRQTFLDPARHEPMHSEQIDVQQMMTIKLGSHNIASSFRLTTKGLNIALENPIKDHAAFVYTNIYRHPYKGNMYRHCHGIKHVCRAAAYLPVLANLYRKHGDKDALNLTEDDIKLLQIAALFHDAAREDDGVDRWDHESAGLLYTYLSTVLQIPQEKALLIAEATANKDLQPDGCSLKLNVQQNGDLSWSKNTIPASKTIYQKLIHDADCLDIIRARPAFSAEYLDFYKDHPLKDSNELAFEEMAQLITEARKLITEQGDTYRFTSSKPEYETPLCYERTMAFIHKDNGSMLHELSGQLLEKEELQNMDLISKNTYQPAKGITEDNINAAMREGKVFVRGIYAAASECLKHNNSSAEQELYKTFRTEGIKTRSTKKPSLKKHGNPSRSVTMIGYGTPTYARAGLMVVNPEIDKITEVCIEDADTGRGKKSTYIARTTKTDTKSSLDALRKKVKMGGVGRVTRNNALLQHNEIIYQLTKYDAIYFSNDPRITDFGFNTNTAPEIAKLEALYIRQAYQRQYEITRKDYLATWGEKEGEEKFLQRFGNKAVLPIFEYSPVDNQLREVPQAELSDDNIVRLWENLARQEASSFTMLKSLTSHNVIAAFKEQCLYSRFFLPGSIRISEVSNHSFADEFYSTELKTRIDATLTNIRNEAIEQHRKSLLNFLSGISQDNSCYKVACQRQMFYLIAARHDQNQTPRLRGAIWDLITKPKALFNYTSLEAMDSYSTSGNEEIFSCYTEIFPGKEAFLFSLCKKAGFVEEEAGIKAAANKWVEKLIDKIPNMQFAQYLKIYNIIENFELGRNNLKKLSKCIPLMAKDFQNFSQLHEFFKNGNASTCLRSLIDNAKSNDWFTQEALSSLSLAQITKRVALARNIGLDFDEVAVIQTVLQKRQHVSLFTVTELLECFSRSQKHSLIDLVRVCADHSRNDDGGHSWMREAGKLLKLDFSSQDIDKIEEYIERYIDNSFECNKAEEKRFCWMVAAIQYGSLPADITKRLVKKCMDGYCHALTTLKQKIEEKKDDSQEMLQKLYFMLEYHKPNSIDESHTADESHSATIESLKEFVKNKKLDSKPMAC